MTSGPVGIEGALPPGLVASAGMLLMLILPRDVCLAAAFKPAGHSRPPCVGQVSSVSRRTSYVLLSKSVVE